MDEPPTPNAIVGRINSASALLAIAVRASADAERDPSQTLVSVAFAAAAAEAFLPELVETARAHAVTGSGLLPPTGFALAELFGSDDVAMASPPHRYQLAKVTLSGVPFDRGAEPFQGFQVLCQLRNEVMHTKPALVGPGFEPHGREKAILRYLESAGVIHSVELRKERSLLAAVSGAATAKWACRAAVVQVRALIESIPPSGFLQLARFLAWKPWDEVSAADGWRGLNDATAPSPHVR